MRNPLPRIVSEQATKELDAERDSKTASMAPRTVFLEALSAKQFVRVDICGEWHEDMAEALINFIARRQRQSAPVVETAHNSGEGLPSSDAAEAGADTPTDTGSVT